ncbi:MAG: spore coat polysaccharide biosynthesis protein SpsF [Candidatus Paceibacteria bacterium]
MNSLRVAVVVLARAGSNRLPGKMMEPFGSGSVLSSALQRCRSIASADEIILATTTCPQDDALAAEAIALGIAVVRGSENDVVERMLQALDALEEPCDVIVRACADNPLFMPSIVDAAVAELIETRCDMLTPFEYATLPFGFGLVVMTRDCLSRIDANAKSASYREHVENYCLEHPDQFHVRYQIAPEGLAWPELCMTLDYGVDLTRLRLLLKVLDGVPIQSQPQAVIDHLRSAQVWIEGLSEGSPDGHDLILLADDRPGLQAPLGVLLVNEIEVDQDRRHGLRYTNPLAKGFPAEPVFLDDTPGLKESALDFLVRTAEMAVPLLLAAPARPINLLEFCAPPPEKRVLAEQRRGFRAPAEEAFPLSVVLDHAEHAPELLEALLSELEQHEESDLFLAGGNAKELAHAVQRLGADRVHEGCRAADPFRVLTVTGSDDLVIPGARRPLREGSMASFWRSPLARGARAEILNREAAE